MSNYVINHLRELESEAIFVIREIAAQFENPVLLFSGGKDSILLTHLAKKAFYPAKIPFPLMHVDTGHNFPETIAFRDALVKKLGVQLIVGSVQESIDKGRAKEETGADASRNALQIVSLLDTLEEYKVDAVTAFEIFEHLLAPFNVLRQIETLKLVATIPLNLWFAKAQLH